MSSIQVVQSLPMPLTFGNLYIVTIYHLGLGPVRKLFGLYTETPCRRNRALLIPNLDTISGKLLASYLSSVP